MMDSATTNSAELMDSFLGVDLKWWHNDENKILDDQQQVKMIDKFIEWVKVEYPNANLSIRCKSLSEAKQAVIHDTKSNLLILNMHHQRSIAFKVWFEKIARIDMSNFLANQPILWPWDVSTEANYNHFLQLVQSELGAPVAVRLGFWGCLVDVFPLMVCILISPDHPMILNIIDFLDTNENFTINSILSASTIPDAESKNLLKQTWLLNLGNLYRKSPKNLIEKLPKFLKQMIVIEETKRPLEDGSLDLERDRLGDACESLIIIGCSPKMQEKISEGLFRFCEIENIIETNQDEQNSEQVFVIFRVKTKSTKGCQNYFCVGAQKIKESWWDANLLVPLYFINYR